VEKITEVKTHRTVVGDLPTASLDYIQSLGTKNRSFVVDGGITGSAGVSQLRSLPGTTGSITYSDANGVATIPQTQLFYIDVKFDDKESAPMLRKFSLSAIEVI
jgi:hypothetical protein